LQKSSTELRRCFVSTGFAANLPRRHADSIELIKRYTAGVDAKEFEEDIQLQDSVDRRREIIPEAVKHLPVELRERSPEVPWRAVALVRQLVQPPIGWHQISCSRAAPGGGRGGHNPALVVSFTP
jgi:hypothetical protein